ncbi:hypothetical protein F6I08_05110 [Aerococcus tenax]|nr:hypothetical protein F6I08_05110 [Aerococcus tenax]MDK8133199.1 hypothetical protein [Aerococcus urinae]
MNYHLPIKRVQSTNESVTSASKSKTTGRKGIKIPKRIFTPFSEVDACSALGAGFDYIIRILKRG